jgi:pyruvate dehydrogenase E2 component (dihydrolipoyllysine-residue acetyltransferase)
MEPVPADVIMPMLGMAQETGKVLRWLKRDGETVRRGEPLLEVETDKVTVEIEAPADGTLAGVRVGEGVEVPVGEVIALVLAEGEPAPVADTEPRVVREVEALAAAPVTVPSRRRNGRLASPKARRLAEERGVDLDSLTGSGPNGAIVAADIEHAEPRKLHVATISSKQEPPGVSGVWKTMAQRTQRAWQEVPHFYLHRDVDATRLQSWKRVAPEGTSVTDLLIKVCAAALERHPRVNAGDKINVGVAVATDDALIVPVVHDADTLTLQQISERRRAIAEAARAGRLRPEDVQGGSFTISNLGMYGVDAFQAIVNAPQAAILAVGRTTERPWVVDGRLVVRPAMTLSVSFDHRVVDGARGAEFLDTLASLIEEPAGLVA